MWTMPLLLMLAPSALAWPARPRLRRLGPAEYGGAAGATVGWLVTPKMTREAYPDMKVRTAEAWRKKILARKPIPLSARAPRILSIALACGLAADFASDYAAALPEHGAVGSLAFTRAGALYATTVLQAQQARDRVGSAVSSAGARLPGAIGDEFARRRAQRAPLDALDTQGSELQPQ